VGNVYTFFANLFKTTCAKFYHNQPWFMTKTFGLLFLGHAVTVYY